MADFNVDDIVKTTELLSTGQTAEVYLAKDTITDKEYALKVIDKTKLDCKKLRNVANEIKLVKELDHPHIIKTYYTREDPVFIEIFMEKYTGDLSSYLAKAGKLTEYQGYIIFRQLVLAVHYLHDSQEIIHADIKLENILFNDNDTMDVVLADFGLSFKRSTFMNKVIGDVRGTPLYYSPELRMSKYHTAYPNDIYALGICLYQLLVDPKLGDVEKFRQAKTSLLTYLGILEMERINKLKLLDNKLLKDLLERMLAHNEKDRITIKEIIAHPWFNSFN